MVNEIKSLNVPLEESVRYEKNYIKTAVCELRFPTLLELETTPPVKLQSALRKLYPYYREEQSVSLRFGSTPTSEKVYYFESKKRDWTISLKPSSIALETKKYTDFNDFIERFTFIFNAVSKFLDTDFFTRVGLRYINNAPLPSNNMDRKDISKWINAVLVAPLLSDELGSLTTLHSEISGHTEDGRYTFRHGFAPPVSLDNEQSISYLLDYDYFKDGVEYDDVLEIIKKFNTQNYNLFKWSLGEESIKSLGKGTSKK